MADRILVTGGAQRLGAELVRAFAQAGWEVWCHYQHSARHASELQNELQQTGASVNLIQADLSRQDEVLGMVQAIEQRGGHEVSHMTGRTEDGRIETVEIVPRGSKVANYAFDVTPARFVTGLITERGVIAANREAIATAFPERATQ